MAKTAGEEQALIIYQKLIDYTRETAQAVPARRYVFYSNHIEYQDNWSDLHFTKHLQHGADLGQRMEQAFSTALEQRDKAVIIGSDCANITPAIIEQAFQKLDEVPFVIGPAMDGGYYLLGMNYFVPSLFENMTWSTDQVCAETIRRIENLGQDYFLLETLSDIDTEEDWNKYGSHLG